MIRKEKDMEKKSKLGKIYLLLALFLSFTIIVPSLASADTQKVVSSVLKKRNSQEIIKNFIYPITATP